MKSKASVSQTMIINNVPLGTIMPYIGTSLPSGWLWCKGGVFPTGSKYTNLANMLGGVLHIYPIYRECFCVEREKCCKSAKGTSC